ncbi:hypothetical protein Ahy_A03g015070 isoform A [Arachis hypogaea]|uniref:Uncharacterized protein n=1 Tax=Arachis hypogaea TaxID=3818 RepID=A0A445DZT1_ARAHY|nr:hypothetical protein Ahy_A03g015070 isoform A [Arachis hypogaea]
MGRSDRTGTRPEKSCTRYPPFPLLQLLPSANPSLHPTQELPSSCSRASRRILHVGCSHLAVLLCARLLAPPSASECSSCACWLLLVVRGCLCSILPPSLTRVSSQSLASRGSSVSSPAAEATRGVVSCLVAFRGVVADSPSTSLFNLLPPKYKHHRYLQQTPEQSITVAGRRSPSRPGRRSPSRIEVEGHRRGSKHHCVGVVWSSAWRHRGRQLVFGTELSPSPKRGSTSGSDSLTFYALGLSRGPYTGEFHWQARRNLLDSGEYRHGDL